jgi:hypothetical protein
MTIDYDRDQLSYALANALRERDEARAKLDDWENAAKHVESDHSDEVHCSCVPVLRKLLNDSKKERDEAREVLQEIEAARWHTACELRRIATAALGNLTIPTK